MEEFVTAHESLNFMHVNLSEDPESRARQEPSLGHGNSNSTNILLSPSSPSSMYHSARAESMIKSMSKFELEMTIEYSKAHWSQLREPDEDEEYSPEANLEHFERLKAHRGWGDFFRDFDSLVVGEQIGEGAQAKIYAATLSGLYECVVKVFKEGYPLRDLQRLCPEGLLKSYNEMTWPSSGSHYNYGRSPEFMKSNGGPLESIHGGTLLKDERFMNRFAIVMERQWGGDLRNLIDAKMLKNDNHGPPFPTHMALKLMVDIARDIRNLHQKYGIIHRDVKASNVLLRHSVGGDLPLHGDVFFHHSYNTCSIPIVLADYECSLGVVGTAFWRAPEILQQLMNKTPASKMKFSYEADIYSYGMTCYEIITGRIPFEDNSITDYDFILNGARPELPHDLEPSIKEVLIDCWHLNPSQRPHINDIIDRLQSNLNLIVSTEAQKQRGPYRSYQYWMPSYGFIQ